ncbi:MAG: deiodinase-like protein, partial [Tepidisphaeraceae bacterium]
MRIGAVSAAWLTVLFLCGAAFAQAGAGQGQGPGGGMRRDPAQMLQRMRDALSDVKLTDDQKPKIDAIFDKADKDLKEMMADGANQSPQERMPRMRELMQSVREEVHGVLTEEQRMAFDEKLAQMRGGGGQGAGPGGGRGGAVARLRDVADQLDLTDDQKSQVQTILEDAGQKMRELRDQGLAPEEMRPQAQKIGEDARGKVHDLLTPDQQKKLEELMQQAPAQGEGGRGNRGAGQAPPPPGGDKPGPGTRPSGSSGNSGLSPPVGIASVDVGKPAPDFELKKLDGQTVQLSSFKGKLLVLVFGSYTSPAFRSRAASLEELRREFNTRASFLLVYTKEAHPSGGWEVERNADEKIQVALHKDDAARRAVAKT